MADVEAVKRRLVTMSDLSALEDCFALCVKTEDHETNGELRKNAAGLVRSGGGSRALDLYWRTHLFDAKVSLDSYCLYIEKDRPLESRFYQPRRKQLLPLARALQDLEDRKITLLGLSLPPGVGKTTLAEFMLSRTAGLHPDKANLVGSHSNSFLRGMYGEMLRILDPNGDYLWNDVFPELKVISTNAQDMLIDIGQDKRDGKRFATLEFSSIGSGNAGKVRAENLLYCDDLVDGLESAMSRERMDKLYNTYAVDLRQRKLGDMVCELHIATRWSVHDPLGRLEQLYDGNPTARFITVPAMDENDESLFDYPFGKGYTTAQLREQREAMDDASWRALFMNQPIEREGQLYPESELRRYFELPDGEPDAILAVCDTKDRGSDYCVLPIVYQYGSDFYIDDLVCDNSAPDVVEARLASKLVENRVQMAQFESNSAGGKIAEKVQGEVKRLGGITKITTRWTSANKETKIIVNSPWVKEHCLFKDNSVIKQNKEYRTFLSMLTGYTMAGKNKHDDVPDAMAQLALYAQGFSSAKVEVGMRPW